MGELSGKREHGRNRLRSRKSFGYGVRQSRARPSNTTVRDLLSNERYTEAVLRFLKETRMEEVKEEIICKNAAG